MTAQQQDKLVGRLFAGRFEVQACLGSGAMARVYLARHAVLGRDVALKLLHRRWLADREILKRFEREARAASRIDHPSVPKIFDFGHSPDEGLPYLVMEHAPGTTLATVIAEQGPLELDRALRVLVQLSEALAAAHTVGVVHRDLKPQNMVLSSDEGVERVKVLDFGLAKIIGPQYEETLTVEGFSFGTPAYMSPEQILERPVDHRADLYGLGTVAFEMLTGRPPFGGSLVEILAAHTDDEPPPPASLRPEIPAELADLVLACMAKDSADRPPAARGLAAALRGLGAGEAGRGRGEPPPPERPW